MKSMRTIWIQKNLQQRIKDLSYFKNMIMSEIVVDSKIRRILHDYVPSPVPAIWVLKNIYSLHFWIYLSTPYFTSRCLKRGAKKCSEFDYLWPSEKYLDLTFEE